MTEIWESSFIENQIMWGFKPADSAILTKDLFLEKKVKDILIPGIGYGRNAKVFIENGINVTGIEISKTAINLARENDLDINIFHDSDSVKQEFGKYGLIESSEILEPHKDMEDKPPFKFIVVKCKKEKTT